MAETLYLLDSNILLRWIQPNDLVYFCDNITASVHRA
jgi:hypothetical protein